MNENKFQTDLLKIFLKYAEKNNISCDLIENIIQTLFNKLLINLNSNLEIGRVVQYVYIDSNTIFSLIKDIKGNPDIVFELFFSQPIMNKLDEFKIPYQFQTVNQKSSITIKVIDLIIFSKFYDKIKVLVMK